jgi:hypothetical protein
MTFQLCYCKPPIISKTYKLFQNKVVWAWIHVAMPFPVHTMKTGPPHYRRAVTLGFWVRTSEAQEADTDVRALQVKMIIWGEVG